MRVTVKRHPSEQPFLRCAQKVHHKFTAVSVVINLVAEKWLIISTLFSLS